MNTRDTYREPKVNININATFWFLGIWRLYMSRAGRTYITISKAVLMLEPLSMISLLRG